MMDIKGDNREKCVVVNENAELLDDTDCRIFDTYHVGEFSILSEIRIMAGWVVDAIQFVYNKDDCTPLYGGPGGELLSLSLQDGEHIVQIDWVTGIWEGEYEDELMAYVCFRTNFGNVLAAGAPDTCTKKTVHTQVAEPGTYFHAFIGRYADYVLGLDTFRVRKEDWYMFDDTSYVQSMHRLSEIRINSGYVVDGIRLVYDDNIETHYHGGHGGSCTTLKLQDDEYITSISEKTGEYNYQDGRTLCSIEFHTNKGRSISGGTARECRDLEEYTFTATDDMQIFALEGCYSHYMRYVIVGMYTMRHTASKTGINGVGEESPVQSGISLKKAVDSGCFSKSKLNEMYTNTMQAIQDVPAGQEVDPNYESALIQRCQKIVGSLVTSLCVTTDQYVFRSPIGQELEHIMQNETTWSRSAKKKEKEPNKYKTPPIILTQEEQNKGQFDCATILRIAATKTSYMPLSQFSSFALDYHTASLYDTAGEGVLALKLIPNSPLLGLNKEREAGTGEDQFQILNGTAVEELYHFNTSKKRWEKYDFGKKKWNKANAPYNVEYNENYKKDHYMGEL